MVKSAWKHQLRWYWYLTQWNKQKAVEFQHVVSEKNQEIRQYTYQAAEAKVAPTSIATTLVLPVETGSPCYHLQNVELQSIL